MRLNSGVLTGRRMRTRILLACLLIFPVTSSALSVVDDLGVSVELPTPVQRIISLAPHITENLFVVGAEDKIVGTSDYSDYPPAARAIRRVGGATTLDVEAILSLRPDLVIAWHSGGNRDAVQRLRELGLRVFVSEPRSLEDIGTTLERFAKIAGRSSDAPQRYRQQLLKFYQRYRESDSRSFFYQLWDDPLLTVNGQHIISHALAHCGLSNVFASLPVLAPTVAREAVIAANPELIVVSAGEGPHADWIARWQVWLTMRAVSARQIHTVSADAFGRSTPRFLSAVESLCEEVSR